MMKSIVSVVRKYSVAFVSLAVAGYAILRATPSYAANVFDDPASLAGGLTTKSDSVINAFWPIVQTFLFYGVILVAVFAVISLVVRLLRRM